MPRVLRIATRESPLALWQANFVSRELSSRFPGLQVELVPVSTLGDRDRVEPLRQFGGQGAFTREVQHAVLSDSADIAVHSLKDLPTVSVPELTLAGLPERAPRCDALVGPIGQRLSLVELPAGARVGTGSPRRRSQLLKVRPDLLVDDIRGNVETRLQKVDSGEFAATLLAEAGLRRLGLESRIHELLAPPVMYPAVGQAALGIECRANDVEVVAWLNAISDDKTRAEVLAERSCLRVLEAGCHAPLGIWTDVSGDTLTLTARILSQDGRQHLDASATGKFDDPESLGKHVAALLLSQGAAELL